MKRSAENYIKTIENVVAVSKLNQYIIEDGIYEIKKNGNLCKDKTDSCSKEEEIKVDVKGSKPSGGKVVISNGQITKDTIMIINEYHINYNEDKIDAWIPYQGIICKAVKEVTNQQYYDSTTQIVQEIKAGLLASEVGPYTYGVEYVCDLGDGEENIFYVLEDGDTTKLKDGRLAQKGEISLIMNKIIDLDGKGTNFFYYQDKVGQEINTVRWCEDEKLCKTNGEWDNTKGPITAIKELKARTINWTNLNQAQIKLPTYNQIFEVNKSNYLPIWLSINNITGGYWTSTPASIPASSYRVYGSYLSYYDMKGGWSHGIRPVITISKSNISY